MRILFKKNFSIASDFKEKYKKEKKIKISLNLNTKSSILYLKRNWKLNKITSKNDWLKYNEPEKHLFQIAKIIENYSNTNFKKKIVFCSSYKDISLQDRLRPIEDNYILGKKKNGYRGVEICQHEINKVKIEKKFNIVLCRHILEHAFNLEIFVKNLKKISTNEAIFYFEVPDCEKLVKKQEYLMIWEEHLTYFFKSTLSNFLENNNFKIIKFIKIKQEHEDLLCVLAKKNFLHVNFKHNLNYDKKKIYDLLKNYKENFTKIRNKVQAFFKKYSDKKIILFGAGHTANTFINLFNLSSKINYIVDENKKKIGKFFPSTNIKIIDIKKFRLIKKLKICLITSDPIHDIQIEKKLKDKYTKIYSIITCSKKFILND
jgi:hypothetical protein